MNLYKHIRILEFALSSLFRRKFKNLVTVLMYSLIVFLTASLLFLTHALTQEAVELLQGSPGLIVQRIKGGRHELVPLRYAGEIEKIRGVSEVIPRFWGYYYDPPTGANYTFMGADELPPEIAMMIEGAFYNKNDRGGCIIGQGVADVRFLELEDIIPVKKSDGELYILRVRGIFKAESNLLTNDLIVMSISDINTIFGIPAHTATDLVVRVRNPREVSTVARKILDKLPDTRPIEKAELIRTYKALFAWRSGLMAAILLGSVTAFFIMIWDKATGLSAEERKEIGILKAIGWEISDVLYLKFWEGVVISTVSFLAGIIAAHVHVFWFGSVLFLPILKGWSVLFPRLNFTPRIDFFQIFVIMFLTVIPYIIATIVPSWKAAVTDPDTITRT